MVHEAMLEAGWIICGVMSWPFVLIGRIRLERCERHQCLEGILREWLSLRVRQDQLAQVAHGDTKQPNVNTDRKTLFRWKKTEKQMMMIVTTKKL